MTEKVVTPEEAALEAASRLFPFVRHPNGVQDGVFCGCPSCHAVRNSRGLFVAGWNAAMAMDLNITIEFNHDMSAILGARLNERLRDAAARVVRERDEFQRIWAQVNEVLTRVGAPNDVVTVEALEGVLDDMTQRITRASEEHLKNRAGIEAAKVLLRDGSDREADLLRRLGIVERANADIRGHASRLVTQVEELTQQLSAARQGMAAVVNNDAKTLETAWRSVEEAATFARQQDLTIKAQAERIGKLHALLQQAENFIDPEEHPAWTHAVDSELIACSQKISALEALLEDEQQLRASAERGGQLLADDLEQWKAKHDALLYQYNACHAEKEAVGELGSLCGLHDQQETDKLVCRRCVEANADEGLMLVNELKRHLADADARMRALDRRVTAAEALKAQVEAVLDMMPAHVVVRVREGGGPEDLAASLAVSVAKLFDERNLLARTVVDKGDDRSNLREELLGQANTIVALQGDLATAQVVEESAKRHLLRLAKYRDGICIECAHKHPRHCHRCGLGAALKEMGMVIEEHP